MTHPMLLYPAVLITEAVFRLGRRLSGERGQTMVEYGILAALVSVAIIAAIVLFRGQLVAVFNRITQALQNYQ